MEKAIDIAWARIRKWYASHLPDENSNHVRPSGKAVPFYKFENGANLNEIKCTEEHLGVTFPQEVRDSYSICNGLHLCGLSNFGYFNSLKEIAEIWDFYRTLGPMEWQQQYDAEERCDPAIRKVFLNKLHIPLTDNQDGSHVMLDLDPTGVGIVGQIIRFERLKGARKKLGNSLSDWLNRFADDLESGRYLIDLDAQSLIPANEW